MSVRSRASVPATTRSQRVAEREGVSDGPAGAQVQAPAQEVLGAGPAGLLGVHALDLAQDEHRAVDLAQVADGGLEQRGQLAVAKLLLRGCMTSSTSASSWRKARAAR